MNLDIKAMSREELEQRFEERGRLIDSLVAHSIDAWAALGYQPHHDVGYPLAEAIRRKLAEASGAK